MIWIVNIVAAGTVGDVIVVVVVVVHWGFQSMVLVRGPVSLVVVRVLVTSSIEKHGYMVEKATLLGLYAVTAT